MTIIYLKSVLIKKVGETSEIMIDLKKKYPITLLGVMPDRHVIWIEHILPQYNINQLETSLNEIKSTRRSTKSRFCQYVFPVYSQLFEI